MNRVVSADWVLPIEGPPIEDGAIVIEDGLIAAVGTAEDLGEGTRYDDAVIVPGIRERALAPRVRGLRRLR